MRRLWVVTEAATRILDRPPHTILARRRTPHWRLGTCFANDTGTSRMTVLNQIALLDRMPMQIWTCHHDSRMAQRRSTSRLHMRAIHACLWFVTCNASTAFAQARERGEQPTRFARTTSFTGIPLHCMHTFWSRMAMVWEALASQEPHQDSTLSLGSRASRAAWGNGNSIFNYTESLHQCCTFVPFPHSFRPVVLCAPQSVHSQAPHIHTNKPRHPSTHLPSLDLNRPCRPPESSSLPLPLLLPTRRLQLHHRPPRPSQHVSKARPLPPTRSRLFFRL